MRVALVEAIGSCAGRYMFGDGNSLFRLAFTGGSAAHRGGVQWLCLGLISR